MNSEHLSRLSQMKQYIKTLNDSLTDNDRYHAISMMTRFKKAVVKQDSHHNNQFKLDCLRSQNQKLKAELEQLTDQKMKMEARSSESISYGKGMKQSRAAIFISRLTLSLNQVKKVEYQDILITCDYNNICITNSENQSKYKNYSIAIDSMGALDCKQNHVYFNFNHHQVHHVLLKFPCDRDAQRWIVSIKFGQLIHSCKGKQKLFEVQTTNKIVAPVNTHTNNYAMTNANNYITMPQIPFLNIGNSNNNKPISPSQSLISDRKSADKSGDHRSGGERSMEKNTERSLVNAMSNEGKDVFNFNGKQTMNTVNGKRIDIVRPPNLTRVRGRSQNIDNSFQISKMYKTTNPRKQSEDIFKPHINLAYHEKMLEHLRSQQGLQDQINSQSTFKNKTPPKKQQLQRTSKIKFLEEKKKQLLRQGQNLATDKPTFAFDNKVSWMGIQQMDDENKSKSSNRMSNKSKKGSEFSESNIRSSQNGKKQNDEDKGQQISERSEEESPRLPTKVSYEVPHKISYANGIVFRLNPIQKGASSPSIPAKEQQTQNKNIAFQKSQNSSQSSDSQSDEHLDPSSHQNHTQSEDNTARAQELKKGIILTKCSENGFWPHEKSLYLSQNQNEICSRDVKDKKIKKIRLSDISNVEYKKFDKGIIRHVSKIEEDKCLVIRALAEDNKIKNYEFVSNLVEPLERFATNLKLFVEYTKKQ